MRASASNPVGYQRLQPRQRAALRLMQRHVAASGRSTFSEADWARVVAPVWLHPYQALKRLVERGLVRRSGARYSFPPTKDHHA